MGDTVFLKFVAARAATLGMGSSKGQSSNPTINYLLQHEEGQSVSTEGGVDLTHREWTMQLTAPYTHNDYIDEQGGIGAMWYSDDPRGCHIGAAVGDTVFKQLLGSVHAPSHITVEVRGLTYVDRKKIWLRASKTAIVTEISFSVPLGEAQENKLLNDGTRNNEALTREEAALYVIAFAAVLICLKLYFG